MKRERRGEKGERRERGGETFKTIVLLTYEQYWEEAH